MAARPLAGLAVQGAVIDIAGADISDILVSTVPHVWFRGVCDRVISRIARVVIVGVLLVQPVVRLKRVVQPLVIVGSVVILFLAVLLLQLIVLVVPRPDTH